MSVFSLTLKLYMESLMSQDSRITDQELGKYDVGDEQKPGMSEVKRSVSSYVCDSAGPWSTLSQGGSANRVASHPHAEKTRMCKR